MSSDSVSFLGGGIFVIVMLEVLTSCKDTDRYHFAEQGFVALHIFILSQDFNFSNIILANFSTFDRSLGFVFSDR